MPAHPVIEADVEWLRREFKAQNLTLKQMAQHCGCCVDTLKRILNRHNIAVYSAAKYQTSSSKNSGYWNRPSMMCGSKKRRPKNQYICTPCKDAQADETPYDIY